MNHSPASAGVPNVTFSLEPGEEVFLCLEFEPHRTSRWESR